MRILPAAYDDLRLRAGISNGAVAFGILCAWLVPAMLAAFETVVFWRMAEREYPVWLAIALQTPAFLAYAVLTPVILRVAEALPFEPGHRVRRLFIHAMFALLTGGVYAVVAAATWTLLSPFPPVHSFGRSVITWYLSGLPVIALCYTVIVGGSRALFYFARSREAEVTSARLSAQLSDARLGALRMQLHPHFLFNTLNAITVLVRDRESVAAERSLELLSGLLRTSLRTDSAHRIPLHEELDFIRRYLEIERVRFSDRLRIRIDIDPSVEHALVPSMVLQPLVENAIRHGISRSAAAGALAIRARAVGDALEIDVSDDGPGLEAGASSGSPGVGVANTRERLRVLYGDAATLRHERAGELTVAKLVIPLDFGSPADSAHVRAGAAVVSP